MSLQKRFFWWLFGICIIWVILGLSALFFFFAQYYETQTALHVKQSSHYIAEGLKQYGIKYLVPLNTTYRISLIDSKGNVVYDNFVKTNTLTNHANRIEFQESMQHNVAQSYRYSASTKQDMFYYAIKIMLPPSHISNTAGTHKEPFILRIATPYKSTLALLYDMLPYMAFIFFACLLTSIVLARKIADSIIAPLNTLNLHNPLATKSYKELLPLFSKIDSQNKLIDAQIKQLKAKQEEFSAITQNMDDGFLLLDSHGNVLSFNKSALHIFGTLEEGKNIESLCAESWLLESLKRKERTQIREHKERTYHIIIESVFATLDSKEQESAQEKPIGTAIIILDITEKAQREQLRKEFSANVSHELKTPLTSIIAVIEMLQNNLIQPQDIPRFLENIHKEGKRLITLIEEILLLHELDNHYNLIASPLSMQAICKNVREMLHDFIQEKHIECSIEGDDFIVMGEERLLFSLLSQLCENAICYNHEYGRVCILLDSEKRTLCVQDNGIGIEVGYHERVFERFFCVDKSHNSTGLGLSIVKHIAHLHRATISLESAPHSGTKITLQFRHDCNTMQDA